MAVDREVLKSAHCLFAVDRVKDPEMTAFKQEARYRQAQWRERNGYDRGEHSNSTKAIHAGGPTTIPNGSRLTNADADMGHNFLGSSEIWSAALERMSTPQHLQTFNTTRLKSDLLSSMPMCFNLFGELHAHPDRARGAAEFLYPDVGPGEVEVRFEWSPERGSTRYTNDRTAFDAALVVGATAPHHIIGIETKYHEHALPEKKPKPEQVARHQSQREHYRRLSHARPDVFRPGWEELLDTELEQIWRDHLLVLSMLQHSDQWASGCYVLIYPPANVSYARAAQDYQAQLHEDDTSFRALTLDELVDAKVLHTEKTHEAFRERYLWWQ